MSMGSSFLCVCLQASDCCAATIIAVEKIKKKNFIKQRSNQRIEGPRPPLSRDGSNSLENGSKKTNKNKRETVQISRNDICNAKRTIKKGKTKFQSR